MEVCEPERGELEQGLEVAVSTVVELGVLVDVVAVAGRLGAVDRGSEVGVGGVGAPEGEAAVGQGGEARGVGLDLLVDELGGSEVGEARDVVGVLVEGHVFLLQVEVVEVLVDEPVEARVGRLCGDGQAGDVHVEARVDVYKARVDVVEAVALGAGGDEAADVEEVPAVAVGGVFDDEGLVETLSHALQVGDGHLDVVVAVPGEGEAVVEPPVEGAVREPRGEVVSRGEVEPGAHDSVEARPDLVRGEDAAEEAGVVVVAQVDKVGDGGGLLEVLGHVRGVGVERALEREEVVGLVARELRGLAQRAKLARPREAIELEVGLRQLEAVGLSAGARILAAAAEEQQQPFPVVEMVELDVVAWPRRIALHVSRQVLLQEPVEQQRGRPPRVRGRVLLHGQLDCRLRVVVEERDRQRLASRGRVERRARLQREHLWPRPIERRVHLEAGLQRRRVVGAEARGVHARIHRVAVQHIAGQRVLLHRERLATVLREQLPAEARLVREQLVQREVLVDDERAAGLGRRGQVDEVVQIGEVGPVVPAEGQLDGGSLAAAVAAAGCHRHPEVVQVHSHSQTRVVRVRLQQRLRLHIWRAHVCGRKQAVQRV